MANDSDIRNYILAFGNSMKIIRKWKEIDIVNGLGTVFGYYFLLQFQALGSIGKTTGIYYRFPSDAENAPKRSNSYLLVLGTEGPVTR
jgi:hypothetical protein